MAMDFVHLDFSLIWDVSLFFLVDLGLNFVVGYFVRFLSFSSISMSQALILGRGDPFLPALIETCQISYYFGKVLFLFRRCFNLPLES